MVKPILFNTEMVRAILEGRKTVTRRVVKPQPKDVYYDGRLQDNPDDDDEVIIAGDYDGTLLEIVPDYALGDILYVRETFREYNGKYYYKADDLPEYDDYFTKKLPCAPKWHPSIRMPKAAARLWLKVTGVRVERLREITMDGCRAEGIYDDYKTLSQEYHDMLMEKAYPETFAKLWDSTIKKADLPHYGWEADPWVWVVSFERIDKDDV